MVNRIKQIQEREDLTSSRFADAIGIQRAAMSHILSERNRPSLDVLTKILERFTYVDSDWLLFGKGSMLRRENVNQEPTLFENTTEFRTNVQAVPENRPEIRVKPVENTPYPPVIEKVIEKITPIQSISKTVSKIMIFYSDNTFDTFVPEKNKKD